MQEADRLRWSGGAVLLGAVLGAAPVMAHDSVALLECLDQVSEAQAVTGERLFDPRSCIGSVEFLCAELGEDNCADREAAAWQGLAEAALDRLAGAAVDAPMAEEVRDAQAGWEAWMTADCELVAPFSDNPALLGLAGAACRRDAWAERAITLRARAESIF